MSGMTQEEYKKLEDDLNAYEAIRVQLLNDLHRYEKDKREVEEKQQSYIQSFLEFTGLTVSKAQQEQELAMEVEAILATDTSELSSVGLQRKNDMLSEKIDYMMLEIDDIQMQIESIKKRKKEADDYRRHLEQEEFNRTKQVSFQNDPNAFYEQVFFDEQQIMSRKNSHDMACALSAVSAIMSAETKEDGAMLLKAWMFIAYEREAGFAEYRNAVKERKGISKTHTEEVAELFHRNELNFVNARICFFNMVDKLDPQWQALKALYTEDPELADKFLVYQIKQKFNLDDLGRANSSAEQEQDLEARDREHANEEDGSIYDLGRMIKAIEVINRTRAERQMRKMPSFSRLSESQQTALLLDAEMLYRLEFDLNNASAEEQKELLAGVAKFRQKLADNIRNVLEDLKSEEQVQEEREAIQKGLDREITRLRFKQGLKQVLEDKQYSLIVGGAGAFITGTGLLGVAALSAAAASAKAVKEVYKAPVPALEEKKKAASALTPQEYQLLYNKKKEWNLLDGKPQEEPEVQVDYVRADLEKRFMQWKEKLYQLAEERVAQVGTEAKNIKDNVSSKLAGGVAAFLLVAFIAILATVAITPATWPLLAVFSVAGLVGTLGYLIRQKFNNPSASFRELVQEGIRDIRGAVDRLYQTIKTRCARAIDNVLETIFGSFSLTDLVHRQVDRSQEQPSSDHKKPNLLKEDLQSDVKSNSEISKHFNFNPQSLAALNDISKSATNVLSTKLFNHFMERLDGLAEQLKELPGGDNQGLRDAIDKDITALENDWQLIKASSSDPKKFCEVVSEYLELAFRSEELKMITESQIDKPSDPLMQADKHVYFSRISRSKLSEEDRYFSKLIEIKKAEKEFEKAIRLKGS